MTSRGAKSPRFFLFRPKKIEIWREVMHKVDPERIKRAARMYAANQEASNALGIAAGSFSRLCREYEIETPYARKRRRRKEWSRRREVDRLLDGEVELMDLDIDICEMEELEQVLELEW
jgi:hypothetical protein